MEVCFDLFDLNSDGFISGADLVEMLSTVVRLNRHHGEVSKSIDKKLPVELEDGPEDKKKDHDHHEFNQNKEENVGLNTAETIADDELVDIVRSQLSKLGKTMTDNNISFTDFCTIVNSHPQILCVMQINTGDNKPSMKVGAIDIEDRENLPRRRRASTANF